MIIKEVQQEVLSTVEEVLGEDVRKNVSVHLNNTDFNIDLKYSLEDVNEKIRAVRQEFFAMKNETVVPWVT
uniref:NET domain-containing protein n=1 Tax=Steinernema glaseri TaxID=37863 RepID=A0A1I7ZYD3_9BILA